MCVIHFSSLFTSTKEYEEIFEEKVTCPLHRRTTKNQFPEGSVLYMSVVGIRR
jgi:hypothetical protein